MGGGLGWEVTFQPVPRERKQPRVVPSEVDYLASEAPSSCGLGVPQGPRELMDGCKHLPARPAREGPGHVL